MKQKPKLALKKIIVSNLADDAAKRVMGGGEPTLDANCTNSCDETCTPTNNSCGCPSGINTPCETQDNYVCSIECSMECTDSCNNYCFTADGCTRVANCTFGATCTEIC